MDERQYAARYQLSYRLQVFVIAKADITLCTDTFEINRERAIDYLNTKNTVYVVDGYAGVSRSISPHYHCLLISPPDTAPSFAPPSIHSGTLSIK